VELPKPVGTVAVVIIGGASNVAIRRPEGVAARLRISGGTTNLKFDHRSIGAAGGEPDLRDREYDGATDRYDVAVTGGANNLSIDKTASDERPRIGNFGVKTEPIRQTGSSRSKAEGEDLDREGE